MQQLGFLGRRDDGIGLTQVPPKWLLERDCHERGPAGPDLLSDDFGGADTKVIGCRYPHSVDGRIADHSGQIFVDGGLADSQLAAQGGELPGSFAVTAIYRGYVSVADAAPRLDVEPGNEAASSDPDPDSCGHGHLPPASRHAYLDGMALVTDAASRNPRYRSDLAQRLRLRGRTDLAHSAKQCRLR